MLKGKISNLLRISGLLFFSDKVRFYLHKIKNRKPNKKFKSENPEVILPPDYLIYESFQLNYTKYFVESKKSAEWLVNHFAKHADLHNSRVLDWGCGPGRIIRHLPQIMPKDCEFFATDYNKNSIEWCKNYLPGIQFNCNTLEAKLPYESNYFDFIYGISIFTHLSESKHYEWYSELHRILRPGGILLITTQGNNFKPKLSINERSLFEKGQLVVRGNVKEGHRTYSAFHPELFMRSLFNNADIFDFIQEDPKNQYIPQDVWLVKKR